MQVAFDFVTSTVRCFQAPDDIFFHFLGTPKDPIARKKRLRQFRKEQKDQDDKQEKILKGMKDIAKDEEKQKQKDKMTEERSQEVKTYVFMLNFLPVLFEEPLLYVYLFQTSEFLLGIHLIFHIDSHHLHFAESVTCAVHLSYHSRSSFNVFFITIIDKIQFSLVMKPPL